MIEVLIVLGVLLIITLIISMIAYKMAFYSPKKRISNVYDIPDEDQPEEANAFIYKMIEDMQSRKCEHITISSHDGLKLFGRYYHFVDGAPILLQFHGYRGSAERDMCGGNKVAFERGYNCLVVDHRAHGKSEGRTISFGIKERFDVVTWCNYIVDRFGENTLITISGVSMGGATVLMASDLNLPKNVIGIWADCPYSSPKDIINKVVSNDMKLPSWILWPFIWLGAFIFGGVNLNATSAEKALKKVKIPTYIVHGETDKLVPVEMSTKLASINPSLITVKTFKNAGHGMSFIVDNATYVDLEDEFWQYCIKEYYNKLKKTV